MSSNTCGVQVEPKRDLRHKDNPAPDQPGHTLAAACLPRHSELSTECAFPEMVRTVILDNWSQRTVAHKYGAKHELSGRNWPYWPKKGS